MVNLRSLLFVLLLCSTVFLTGCSSNQNICFKINKIPGWNDYFFANRTEHRIVGEDLQILVTTCKNNQDSSAESNKEIDNAKTDKETQKEIKETKKEDTDTRSSSCIINGEVWQCSISDYCVEGKTNNGDKVGFCYDR